MSFFSKKIKGPKRTQIIADGLVLDELIKEDVLAELKNKFSDEEELITTFMRFHVMPKKKPPGRIKVNKGEEKEIIIGIGSMDQVTLDHPSPDHHKKQVVVITSNRNRTLERFLK